MRKNAKGDILLPIGFAVTVDQSEVRDYEVRSLSVAVDVRDGSRYTPQMNENIIQWKEMIRLGFITKEQFESAITLFAKMYDSVDRVEDILYLERHIIAERIEANACLTRIYEESEDETFEEFTTRMNAERDSHLAVASEYELKHGELLNDRTL